MRHILAKRHEGVLAALAESARTLLVFDFDGTLAPIVADRDAARMDDSTAKLFVDVARRYPTAVVSGRALADLVPRLGDAPVRHVVGNHGTEGGPIGKAATERLRQKCHAMLQFVAPRLASLRGVAVEDKEHSLSIHYRASRRPEAAHREILEIVSRLRPAPRIVEGKRVLNVVPKGSPHKGDAVRWLRRRERADLVLFVGDDVTDEDAFAEESDWMVSTRVARSAHSRARYFVRTRGEVDRLVAELCRLRPSSAF